MALIAGQITQIAAQLSVDLSTVTDDRLIELCLLHRAAPEVLPAFVVALEAEITRRFTAAEIAVNDVMFSVINNFSNSFSFEVNFRDRFYELSELGVSQRDTWFTTNANFFEDSLLTPTSLSWLAGNPEIMGYVAASTTASNKVVDTPEAMAGMAKKEVAMSALFAVPAVTLRIIQTPTAINEVALSSTALKRMLLSEDARIKLMNNNAIFQANKVNMYATVSANWVKKSALYDYQGGANQRLSIVNSGIAAPLGFVFATLGWADGMIDAKVEVKHPNTKVAALTASTGSFTTLINLDVVTFNGAIFTTKVNSAATAAELWSPT